MTPLPLGLDSPGPRLTSTPQNRSATRLMAIVAEHLHRGHARYLPRDVTGDGVDETWCNIFVQDVCEAMGAPMPRHRRANELFDWLVIQGALTVAAQTPVGWEKSDAHAGMAMAEQGCLAVAAWKNPTGSGHMAILVPSLGEPGVWAAQAGRLCFTRELLQRGFGAIAPDVFVHP